MGERRPVGYTQPMPDVSPGSPSDRESQADRGVSDPRPVIVVGGGPAGLACAHDLIRHGISVQLFEAGDACGGRLRTDWVDGFPCDRGFQVYLPAYPTASRFLDYASLDLRPFEPGAFIYDGEQLHRFGDPLQNPTDLWPTATTSVVTLTDKLRMAWLKRKAGQFVGDLGAAPNRSTLDELRSLGFSAKAIEHFFRPFFGGVFLDRSLQTTARMLYFTYAMFGRGGAAWPSDGIQAIPDQLAADLPPGTVHVDSPVSAVTCDAVELTTGERVAARRVVVAVDPAAASVLLPAVPPPGELPSTTTLYFTTPAPPVDRPRLVLNGSGRGRVNTVCVLTAAAPERVVDGRHLVSVALQDATIVDDGLVGQVLGELAAWLPHVDTWEPLHHVTVTHALPDQSPERVPPGVAEVDGCLVTGDWRSYGSIEHAMRTGRDAATRLLAEIARGQT